MSESRTAGKVSKYCCSWTVEDNNYDNVVRCLDAALFGVTYEPDPNMCTKGNRRCKFCNSRDECLACAGKSL